MKFGERWLIEINKLPHGLQVVAINYISWKSHINPTTVYERLDSDMKLAGSVLNCKNKNNLWKCMSNKNEHQQYTDDEITQYIELNLVTLRKICKRLDKRLGVDAKRWFKSNKWRYDICSPLIHKQVSIQFPFECPICLELHNKVVISDCSHVFCIKCTQTLFEPSCKSITTLESIIGYRMREVVMGRAPPVFCPICRSIDPFRLRPIRKVEAI